METEMKEPAVAYNRLISIEEFLSFAEKREERLEYIDGEISMMSSTSKAHSIITCNLNRKLYEFLKGKGCIIFQETVNLKIQTENSVYLPDIVATCHPNDLSQKTKFLEYPSIIIEVLSPSTELHDRGIKWQHYRKISSLRYYMMVSQNEPLVEVYGRPHAQSLFYLQDFEGLDKIVDLTIMDIQLPMKDIYEGIVFETESMNQ